MPASHGPGTTGVDLVSPSCLGVLGLVIIDSDGERVLRMVREDREYIEPWKSAESLTRLMKYMIVRSW